MQRNENVISSCISIDLEVLPQSSRIREFAAIRCDSGNNFVCKGGNLQLELAKLDAFAIGSKFLLGHNIIKFDLPHLGATKPDLKLLKLPALDTLWLNPLAFPRNPYHNLVKHYQDCRIK